MTDEQHEKAARKTAEMVSVLSAMADQYPQVLRDGINYFIDYSSIPQDEMDRAVDSLNKLNKELEIALKMIRMHEGSDWEPDWPETAMLKTLGVEQ